MRTKTLIDVLNYVYSVKDVKKYIEEFEAPPFEYIIFQIEIRVINYPKSIFRILINFRDLKNQDVKEDVFIDIQGTDKSNFKILKYTKINLP